MRSLLAAYELCQPQCPAHWEAVAAITFTDAATEISARLRQLGLSPGRRLASRTVHSFCLQHVLLPYGAIAGHRLPPDFQVLDGAGSDQIWGSALATARVPLSRRGVRGELPTLSTIRRRRAAGEDISDFPRQYRQAVTDYERRLREGGLLDFDEMTFGALQVLRGWSDLGHHPVCSRCGLPSPANVCTTASKSQSPRRFAVPDTTCHMSISLDGFVAGPDQSREDPLGKRGQELHGWHIGDPRANDADKVASEWLMRPRGAYVMGRNMFGPIRGDWDEEWTGWWGPEPPYHAPVFVLTHHGHDPIQMDGGTTFHFVTAGFDAAYSAACQAAGDNGVDIAGGASTVRQALIAGVIDELTLDIAPVLLGSGERIFDGVESFDFEPAEVLHSPLTTHIRYRRVR